MFSAADHLIQTFVLWMLLLNKALYFFDYVHTH